VLGSEQHVYFSIEATPASAAGGAAAVVADESAEASILLGSAPNGAARLDPRVTVEPGGRITFALDPARLHFFDPDTGQAISG
jgi:multiple sugar transport system ATP-binding protein